MRGKYLKRTYHWIKKKIKCERDWSVKHLTKVRQQQVQCLRIYFLIAYNLIVFIADIFSIAVMMFDINFMEVGQK